MLPLGTIIKYHKVQYHIYADDTQTYVFKLNDPKFAIDNINKCISKLHTKLRLRFFMNFIFVTLDQ